VAPWVARSLTVSRWPILLKDLLRNELGFEGILLSDAAPMLGLMSRVREEEAAVRFFQAGGDVFLFADPERDPGRILQAVEQGMLQEEDLRRSARRVLELKQTLGLFRDPHGPAPDEPQRTRFQEAADALGTRSICVARDNGRIGSPPPPGARILSVTIDIPGHKTLPPDVGAFESVFESRGYPVERLHNPGHGDIIARLPEVDTVLLNFHLLPHMVMGQSRLVGGQAMALWRGWAHHHPDVRITSFGTPYLLFDQPHLPNLLLAFGAAEVSQRAAARVWLGEIAPQGSLPVSLP
jgi:beta-N-acetylhexosaminidase